MRRLGVQLLSRALLDDAAQVHHCDAIAGVVHHGQIVRDQQVGQPETFLEVLEKIDHLALGGHVERAHRLVQDEQAWAQRQSSRDGDALALPARELVRLAFEMLTGESDELQQFLACRQSGRLVEVLVDVERLAHDVRDDHRGVQRRGRVLEDGLNVAPDLGGILPFQLSQVDAVESHRAGLGLHHAQDGVAGARFPRAGLADETQCLALRYVKAHAVDCVDVDRGEVKEAARTPVGDKQVPDGEQRFSAAHSAPSRVSSAARTQRALCACCTSISTGAAVHCVVA